MPLGSSIDVNQKARLNTSSGVSPSRVHVLSLVCAIRKLRRNRSWIIGTQEIPLSDKTIFSPGNRIGILAYNQSTLATIAFTGKSASVTSVGAPVEPVFICDDEPMCRLTTVPVSSQAEKNGSQKSV